MAMRSLAPGFRFHPTDAELVLYYLKKKVLGRRFHNEAIAEVDIYNFPPWALQGHARLSRDLKWYFFCPRKKKYATGARTKRSTVYGYWKTTGKDKPVINNCKTVGMKRSLVFQRLGGEKKTERTDWMMHEYRLVEDLKSEGVAQDTFVICVIFEKDGPGPRNGAQYGAPFVEEEWEDDDNGEADVPSASGFTQEFILPDMQQHFERYCVGSTSNACAAGPSQMAPSVVNVPPPAPVNDVVMEDFQNPCDEYLHSNGIFIDDIPATSSENARVENLDPINPDGDHRAEYTMDDIFDSLEDIGPYHGVNNSSVIDSDANIFHPIEPFMELDDIDTPLTSVDGAGPSGHNNSGGFDGPIAAQSWTSVLADDGFGWTDLESPINDVGEADQSNEVCYNLGGDDGLVGSATISNPPVFTQAFHGPEVTRDAEDLPRLNRCPQLGVFDGCVDMHQEGYGVECTNQEIVRYDVVAANSSINNPDVGYVHACENQGRGEGTIFCCMLRFLEYPAHPSSAVERPAPCIGAKRSDGHALFLLYGYSSFHIKAEVTLGGGGRGCTNDALSHGLEGFPFADCEENGSGSGKGAANYGCGISSTLFLLTLRSPCCPPWGDDVYYWRLTSWLSFLAAAWLIVHISVCVLGSLSMDDFRSILAAATTTTAGSIASIPLGLVSSRLVATVHKLPDVPLPIYIHGQRTTCRLMQCARGEKSEMIRPRKRADVENDPADSEEDGRGHVAGGGVVLRRLRKPSRASGPEGIVGFPDMGDPVGADARYNRATFSPRATK
ncbi:hypothetical protein ACJRO7_033903 [Eucalyptus globulus]|uniref:NAC domain-containing protein n=1 Tax=Eucalyptus globulus TaxID=34317 RepID=A0ABD3J1F6_EUCGL